MGDDPGALSTRAAFDRDGYVVVRQALAGHDFAPLRRLIERQVDAQAARLAAVRGGAHRGHEHRDFETRWAELAREFAADPAAREHLGLVNATWGGLDMLDEATYNLYTCDACKAIATALLGPDVQANGDYWFRAAVSEDIGVDWGYEYHQDSYNYGTLSELLGVGGDGAPPCQVLSLWIPLVSVDQHSGCLSLVRGSHLSGKIPWEGPAAGWPEGVSQFGTEVCAEAMEPGDGV
jgi:hypothetical protein